MNNNTVTYSGQCPCGCGAVVTVTYGGFAATEVSVEACPTQRAQGIVSYTLRRSASPQQVTSGYVRHSAGLVAIG